MLGHTAVVLNWRLFWRSLQRSSGEFWLVIAATLLAAATMGQSALNLGTALASNQIPSGQAVVTLGLWVSSTFLATFAYALATGELAFGRSLQAELALRPVSRWQAFLTMQCVWTVGPHALAGVSVGLPWLIVLATWLTGVTLLTAIAASFVMMRLAVGLLFSGSRVLSSSIRIAATAIGLISAAVSWLWLAAPDVIIAWSPPGLVVRIVLGSATWPAWTGLAAWTLVVAAVEFWSAGLDASPRSAPISRAVEARPVPAMVALIARLGGCSAVLLLGELVRLVRWRRYQLMWLTGGALAGMMASRSDAGTGLIRAAFVSVVLVNVATSPLANLFATDRAAFYALLMAPTGMRAVVRAKVIAVLLFCLAGVFAGTVFLLARGVQWPLVGAGVILAAGLFMWAGAVGMVSSVLFPMPSDPAQIGGALVSTPAFIVLNVGNGLYLGAAMGIAYMLESRQWSWPICGAAGAALVIAAAFAMRAASDVSPRLIGGRQEAMLAALAAPGART